jgi:hypothetical protein
MHGEDDLNFEVPQAGVGTTALRRGDTSALTQACCTQGVPKGEVGGSTSRRLQALAGRLDHLQSAPPGQGQHLRSSSTSAQVGPKAHVREEACHAGLSLRR